MVLNTNPCVSEGGGREKETVVDKACTALAKTADMPGMRGKRLWCPEYGVCLRSEMREPCASNSGESRDDGYCQSGISCDCGCLTI
jgi:hypothetical protein